MASGRRKPDGVLPVDQGVGPVSPALHNLVNRTSLRPVKPALQGCATLSMIKLAQSVASKSIASRPKWTLDDAEFLPTEVTRRVCRPAAIW